MNNLSLILGVVFQNIFLFYSEITVARDISSHSDRQQCILSALYTDDSKQKNIEKFTLVDNFNQSLSNLSDMPLLNNYDNCKFSIISEILNLETQLAKGSIADLATNSATNDLLELDSKVRRSIAEASEDYLDQYTVQDQSPYRVVLSDILKQLDQFDSGTGERPLGYTSTTFEIDLIDKSDEDSTENLNPNDLANYSVKYGGVVEPDNCDRHCQQYLEFLLIVRIWSAYWFLSDIVVLPELSIRVENAIAENENFFFSAGDGLYPWEIWLNSRSKSDDFFLVPAYKFNFLHPSPFISYEDDSGSVEPAVLLEVIGATKLNFNAQATDLSAPFGGAFAVDFSDDDIRFGAVFHIPLKRVVHTLPWIGEATSKYVPCLVCSFVFLTDGDDNFSFGVKLNAASLLYPTVRAQQLYGEIEPR